MAYDAYSAPPRLVEPPSLPRLKALLIFADAARGTASAIIDCPPPLYWLCGK